MKATRARAAAAASLAVLFSLQGCLGLRLDDGGGVSVQSAQTASSSEPYIVVQEFLGDYSGFDGDWPTDWDYWSWEGSSDDWSGQDWSGDGSSDGGYGAAGEGGEDAATEGGAEEALPDGGEEIAPDGGEVASDGGTEEAAPDGATGETVPEGGEVASDGGTEGAAPDGGTEAGPDGGGMGELVPAAGPQDALDDPVVTTTIVGVPKRSVDKKGSEQITAVVRHVWRGRYRGSDLWFRGKVGLVLDTRGRLRREKVLSGNPLVRFRLKGGRLLLSNVISMRGKLRRRHRILKVRPRPLPRRRAKRRLRPRPLPLPVPGGLARQGAVRARVEGFLSSSAIRVCDAYQDRRGRNAYGLRDSLRQQNRCLLELRVYPTNLYAQETSPGGKILAQVDAEITARFKDGKRYQERGRFELELCQEKNGELSLLHQDGTLFGWSDAFGRITREGPGSVDGVAVNNLSVVNCAVPAAAAAAAAAAPAALTVTLTGIGCAAGVLTGDWNVLNTGGVAYTGNLRFNSLGVQIPPGLPTNFNQMGNSAVVALAPAGNVVVVAQYGPGPYNIGDTIIFNGALGGDPSVVAGTPATVTLGGGSYPKNFVCTP